MMTAKPPAQTFKLGFWWRLNGKHFLSDSAFSFGMFVNMSETDLQLLTRYACKRTEDAFAEIVRRHVDLVHSAAFRQVRSSELAEEVAQAVFIELAQRAGQLPSDTVVGAWLYNQTRRRAIDMVRREAGRRLREQTAQELQAMNTTADDWTHVEPLLDDAMDALEETDRLAVLLRYFQNKPLREVGQAIGMTGDAAQKRVSRAVERLREFFAKRGVTVGASGLVVVISANAIQTAPADLSVSIVMSATATLTNATAPFVVWTKINIAALTLVALLMSVTVTVIVVRGALPTRSLAEEVPGSGLALARDKKTGAPIVMIVVPGSVPARAGLAKGMVVHSIDGVPTAGLNFRECLRRMESHRVVRLELIDLIRDVTNAVQYTHPDRSQNMGGIGIALGRDRNAPATIMAVVPGSPAAAAGLSKGLMIHSIDNVPTKGMNARECLNRIQGTPGSVVRLELINPRPAVTNMVELTRYRL